MKKYFYFLLFSFCFLLIITCTTQPQSGNLTGTVQLAGEADHSGIIIGIYELTTLDPDIDEANTKWPHIGVIINQHTEFDHRFGTLVKTGETDASGYFEIKNIPTGNYNVVAIKDGFGFKYIYEISISDGDNSINEKRKKEKVKSKKADNDEDSSFNLLPLSFNLNKSRADLILFPETTITSDITESTTFESHHHYIIEQDIIVDDELTIEPGAVIRLNEGVKMSIYGDLTSVGEEDNFIWFTSNDSLFSLFPSPFSPITSLFEYKVIELDGTLNKQVSFCKFDHAGTGLLNHVNGFSISNCIFRDSQCGFKTEDVDSTFCSNLLCEEISNEEQAGIYYLQVDNDLIEKNIIKNCENGTRLKDGFEGEVRNNYFTNNTCGSELWDFIGIIKNNEYYQNYWDIRFTGNVSQEIGSIKITYNNFYSINGVSTFASYPYESYSPILINYNNFTSENYFLYDRSGTFTIGKTIDATNNYFNGLENEVDIKEKIYDKDEDEFSAEIVVDNFKINKISNAGILNL